jgi:putative addiction module component (TIGR02574 family)
MINIQEILKLSSTERILIIEKIWASINPQDIEVSQAQALELDKRLARFEQGTTKFHSWESIKKI